MKQQGFTLIEMMVVLAMIAVGSTIAWTVIGATSNSSHISIGINGMTEARCIEGYKFVINQDGNIKQILDEFGKGVRCETFRSAK
jgi:prepilin-type N-terminal cleavage/methylation domain-containing protein